LAARYPDEATLRSKWDTDFPVKQDHSYSDDQNALAQTRMVATFLMAQHHRKQFFSQALDTTMAPPKLKDGDRASLQATYNSFTGLPFPPLDEQGSDSYMAAQWKALQRGDIGDFTTKQIISALPEPGARTTRRAKRHKGTDGQIYETEEEERNDPQDIEAWKLQMRIHQNTFLMCMYATTHHPTVRIEKADLDKYYGFIMGKAILQRKPAPSLRTLIISERKAWQHLRNMVHMGTKLKDALETMRQDQLFWTREVYEYINKSPQPPGGKGNKLNNNMFRFARKNLTPRGSWPAFQGKASWPTPRGKGKGKGKGKSKNSKGTTYYTKGTGKGKPGKGKGKTGKAGYTRPPWAQSDPNN
jgi:hypothetical protein